MARKSYLNGGIFGSVVWLDSQTPGATPADVMNAAADALMEEAAERHRFGDTVVSTLAAGVEEAAQRVLDAAREARQSAFDEQMEGYRSFVASMPTGTATPDQPPRPNDDRMIIVSGSEFGAEAPEASEASDGAD